jgi:predicted transcriptional regulator
MATYLQGVTDYIPQIQPFKPDLNFYQGVLETKQAQYKAGYDQLNNIYGTMLNSELSRADNTERRDQFFNKIQTEIQKISSLDLSRNENVEAAQKVFQPIIDDKYILKDMSFTKTYRREQGKADAFMNCTDEKKCGGKYWEGGVRALDYQRQDFMEADLDQSLGYQNPMYTPYVNVYKKAMDFAKDMGFNTKNVTWTDDGRYMITTKNGPQMITGLTDSFVNAFAGDPAVTGMYKTQAYLDRKDFITTNAERFGGDKMAAEKDYLVAEANKLNEYMRTLQGQAEKDKEKVKVTKEAATESVEQTPLNPDLDKGFADMLNGLDTDEQNANTVATVATESLDATNGIDYNKMSLEALRYRIDTAKANQLLYSDMSNAAKDYAMNTMEQEVDADKYALAKFEHGLRMSEIGYKASLDAEAKRKEKEEEAALEAEYTLNSAEGTPVDTGDSTGVIDVNALIEEAQSSAVQGAAAITDRKSLYVYEKLNTVANGGSNYSDAQKAAAKSAIQDIFGGLGSTDQEIRNTLTGGSEGGIMGMWNSYKKVLRSKDLNSKVDSFAATGGNGLFRSDEKFASDMAMYDAQMAPAKMMATAITQATKDNNKAVRQQMIAEGMDPNKVDMLVDGNGNLRGVTEFKNRWRSTYGDNYWINDEDDGYDELYEKYKKTYNGGKVKIKSHLQGMDEFGASGMAAMATMFSMDPAQLGGMRTKTKELYEQDIAPAMFDKAKGNVRFFTGDITGKGANDIEDLEIDSEDAVLARNMLNDIMRSAFTTKWKGDKADRPTMDIVRHSIVGGDPDKVGVTFSINQNYIDGFKGSAKEKGLLNSMFGAGGTNQISVVMDKSAVKSTFFKELEPTPVEYVFNSQGNITIDAFAGTAGTATISRTPSGMISVTGKMKTFDPASGRLVDVPEPWNALLEDDANINDAYSIIAQTLHEQAQDNITQSRGLIK